MSGRLLGVAVLAATTAVGCVTSRPPAQGDPAAPLLIRGRVVDAGGRGFAAPLSLIVLDTAHSQVGQRIPLLYSHDFTAAPDGSFELHVGVEPELGTAAAANGGYVNFQLMTFTVDEQPMFPFSFPRQLAAGAWAGEAPNVEIGPSGYTDLGAPAATVPPPAS